MTRDELEKRNVGENLDAIMCLDPRGYGVCRILYAGIDKNTHLNIFHHRLSNPFF